MFSSETIQQALSAEQDTESHCRELFDSIRKNTIGWDATIITPYGTKKLLYADWIASGRLYAPIENILRYDIAPLVANTHTETTTTGSMMTLAYHKAQEIIKRHVGANHNDALIMAGSGMTGAISKLQRILGLKIPEQLRANFTISEDQRPVVFITHMEHHSNQTSWLETICTVKIIEPDSDGLVNLQHFEAALQEYADRPLKIAAITACSNVTGISTPYYTIAEIIHRAGGYCFVDFACSAPYTTINMHPENPLQTLDAITFSPHKFLGGPGTPGVLVFNTALYTLKSPEQPGGGTVTWTNPWGEHQYYDDIEIREDGGTPAFLQTIKTALAIKLKEQMGVQNILEREHHLVRLMFQELAAIPGLHILADTITDRIGAISLYIDGLHYNLAVTLLNDRYGIQTRGGCSCAGTYGHYLLNVTKDYSHQVTCKINSGDLSEKPGWIRLSLHPTMTDEEIFFIGTAFRDIAQNYAEYAGDYTYNFHSNEFTHNTWQNPLRQSVEQLFEQTLVK